MDEDGILWGDLVEGVWAEGSCREVGEGVCWIAFFAVGCLDGGEFEGVVVWECSDAEEFVVGRWHECDGEGAGHAEGFVLEGEVE